MTGSEQERATDFIAANMTKPVVEYVAGVTASARLQDGSSRAMSWGPRGGAAQA